MTQTTPNKPPFGFDYIRKLSKLMQETGLNEVEVSENKHTLRLSFGSTASATQQVQEVIVKQEAEIETEIKQSTTPVKTIPSPMVGTFYEAASPESAPFVKIGDKIKKGQTICIIEAMKTMNQIEAEEDGIIKEVLINNAHPVEFGEPLFVIK